MTLFILFRSLFLISSIWSYNHEPSGWKTSIQRSFWWYGRDRHLRHLRQTLHCRKMKSRATCWRALHLWETTLRTRGKMKSWATCWRDQQTEENQRRLPKWGKLLMKKQTHKEKKTYGDKRQLYGNEKANKNVLKYTS